MTCRDRANASVVVVVVVVVVGERILVVDQLYFF